MLTLRLTFPWGRYYAHPWGQNPARITEAEWPPSPWRLLRALAAAWFQSNPGCQPSAQLMQSLEILGRELPSFVLPKVSFSRTVHYQPNFGATPKGDIALGKYKRVRHENHFAAVGGDVLVRWRLNGLDEKTKAAVCSLTGELANRITYFGRAESVCEVSIGDNSTNDMVEARVALQNNQPCRQISPSCRDVFCPDPADFQASDLWKRREDNATKESARKHLVQDLIDAPQPLPDGAAWYSYRMPEGWPQQWIVRHPRHVQRRPSSGRIAAKYLDFSLQCRVPVPSKHVASLAERFRKAALSLHGEPSFALSGHDAPADTESNHQHAFYLPRVNPTGKSLHRLCVWCEHGFTQREVDALLGVSVLYWGDGRFPIRPVLLRVREDLPPLQTARTWQSTTPYVPPRYWYRKKISEGRVRGADSPENQLLRNFRENGLDAEVDLIERIAVAGTDWQVSRVHLSEREQKKKASPDHRVGLFLQIRFSEPASMLLPAYGHSCHFGLGQFSPVEFS